MTFPDPIRAAPPEAPAVLHPDGLWTYADLDRRVDRAVGGWQRAGVASGDRVVLWRLAVLDQVVLFHALWRLGAVAVAVGPRETRVEALAQRVGAATVAAPPGTVPSTAPGALDPAMLLDASPSSQPTEPPWPTEPWWLDRPATVVFTSGSTGEPKAALHTAGHHVWSARGWREVLLLGPGDRWLLDLPLHHVGGMAVLWRCALAGAAVAIARRGEPLPEAARRLGLTHASLVPTQLRRALQHAAGSARSDALARMRLLLLGGAALPEPLLREAAARGWPVAPSYGMTEMASTITAARPGDDLDPPTSGAVLPYREVRIAEDGEVLVRGRTLFAGYLQPDGSLERRDLERPDAGGGWFPTRDLGRWHGTGARRRLQIVGRKDRQFVTGGENVQPEEIERALLALPGVLEAVVVAVEDAEFGHRPVAFVDAPQRPAVDLQALLGLLPLPSFKRPDALFPWPTDLPGSMKPDRRWLEARAAALLRAE